MEDLREKAKDQLTQSLGWFEDEMHSLMHYAQQALYALEDEDADTLRENVNGVLELMEDAASERKKIERALFILGGKPIPAGVYVELSVVIPRDPDTFELSKHVGDPLQALHELLTQYMELRPHPLHYGIEIVNEGGLR